MYSAAIDPFEGMDVFFATAGGFFAVFADFVLVLAGIVLSRVDGEPTTTRRTFTTAAVICSCMSIAVPLLVVIGILRWRSWTPSRKLVLN